MVKSALPGSIMAETLTAGIIILLASSMFFSSIGKHHGPLKAEMSLRAGRELETQLRKAGYSRFPCDTVFFTHGIQYSISASSFNDSLKLLQGEAKLTWGRPLCRMYRIFCQER